MEFEQVSSHSMNKKVIINEPEAEQCERFPDVGIHQTCKC